MESTFHGNVTENDFYSSSLTALPFQTISTGKRLDEHKRALLEPPSEMIIVERQLGHTHFIKII